MNGEQTDVLILRDTQGKLYLMPLEFVEQFSVPAERIAEVEELLQGSEVSGYGGPLCPLGFASAVSMPVTPNLMLACCSGRHFAEASITTRKAE